MNCDNPVDSIFPDSNRNTHKEEIKASASRLTDEKISDESGTETTSDSALAPAGLKNPFWN